MNKLLRKLTLVFAAVAAMCYPSFAAIDFATVADSSITKMQTAASSAGPAVIGIVGVLIAIGLVIRLLRRAGR